MEDIMYVSVPTTKKYKVSLDHTKPCDSCDETMYRIMPPPILTAWGWMEIGGSFEDYVCASCYSMTFKISCSPYGDE